MAIDLAILYAEPLVAKGSDGSLEPVPRLDFGAERDRIFDSLTEAGRAITVRVEAATADNLGSLVTLGCRALHYSGHGHPDYLAFEDGRGGTNPLGSDPLRQLIAAGGAGRVQLAFLSACHSRQAGEAFVAAGVPHVIAIRLDEPVFDEAARTFASACYLALAAGQTVRQAFDSGRARVRAQPPLGDPDWDPAEERDKFLLLPEDGDHDLPVFADAPPGEWRDVTPPTPATNLPAKPKDLLGRSLELHEVVQTVLRGRLLTVRGAPGIGKTALAEAAGRYLNDRRLFRDGVLFISMRGAESAETARARIAAALGIEPPEDDAALFAELRRRRCLLILDNCEDPLHHERVPFRGFVSSLLREAGSVKVLITSREALGGGLPGVTETVRPLGQLEPGDATLLFVRRAAAAGRALALADILAEDFATIRRILRGHPQAIELAAAQLGDKTLERLRSDLETQPVATLLVESVSEDQRSASESLAISLGVSARCVAERSPEAARLFSVMGLLPGGALGPDLDAVWGEGWRAAMDVLVRASLVQCDELGEAERFSAFPFVSAYAALLLTPDGRVLFALRAGEHFARVSESLYQSMGTGQAGGAYAVLALEEENLVACLDAGRPARPKRESEEASPVGYIATYLPQLLMHAGRARDGIRAADRGRKACRGAGDVRGEVNVLTALGDLKVRVADLEGARADYGAALPMYRAIHERLGEANVLQALGDLEVRVADLEGARADYGAALPMYRQIHARLGEANVLKGMGNLQLAEGHPEDAVSQYRAALAIHVEVQDRLGAGGALGYLSRTASAAERHPEAALFGEEAIGVFRAIGYRFGEALALADQASALAGAGEVAGAMGGWWRERALYRAMGDSARAAAMDGVFSITEGQLGPDDYRALAADLEAHAEERRAEAVARLRETAGADPLLLEVQRLLEPLRSG